MIYRKRVLLSFWRLLEKNMKYQKKVYEAIDKNYFKESEKFHGWVSSNALKKSKWTTEHFRWVEK